MRLPVLQSPNDDDSPDARTRRSLVERLARRIDGEVRIGAVDRGIYATDASVYQVEPLAVVVPRTRDDLRETIAFCAEHGLAVIGRGGGTSLAGQTVGRAVIVDCSRHLALIDELDVTSRTVRVEPGVVLDDLRAALAPHGLGFGPDVSTATHATLGGMIMNCSAGSYSLRYGMTDEHVVSIDALLADGTPATFSRGAGRADPRVAELERRVGAIVRDHADAIRARFPAVRRNVAGYKLDDLLAQLDASTPGTSDRLDLARLLCGSEGTLAFVERARLSLVELPRVRGLAVVGFRDVHAAMDAMTAILATDPVAVELIDDAVIGAARAQEVFRADVELLPRVDGGLPGAALFVEFFCEDQSERDERYAALAGAISTGVVAAIREPELARRLWSVRTTGLGLISKSRGTTMPMPGVEDCAVPVERLAAFQRAFESMLASHGTTAVYYAHASVGLLHVRPRIDVGDAADRDRFERIAADATDLVMAHGGSISGEHGDGRIRAAMVHRFYGEEIVGAFREIKALFDPDNRLNPDNKIVARPMLDDLRVEPGGSPVRDPTVDTFFDWSAEGSVARAAIACNGNGLCRRHDGGAMCPSYRALRDERHATRGRANALRLAITGQLGGDGAPDWNDDDVVEALSLCLACKACRHECPSNVDLSKLKSEYLAQRRRAGVRPSLRDRLLADVRRSNRIGSFLHPLANVVVAFEPVRRMLASLLGVAPERPLPLYDRDLVARARDRKPQHVRELSTDAPVVLLYPDCFTRFNESTIGLDAITVLESFGYRVEIAERVGCCGRPKVSLALLPEAAREIGASATALETAIDATGAVGVVVLEPSCASAIEEEWRELRGAVPPATSGRIAARTATLERFLLERWETHPRRPAFRIDDQELLVHQHCHQKHRSRELGELLRRCGFQAARVLDSGCCGMAGSFGYKAESFDLSVAIAADSLGGPMTEVHERGCDVVAPGVSCRHQMLDVFDVVSRHPATLLAAALRSRGV